MIQERELSDIDYEIFSLPKKEVRIMEKYMHQEGQLRLRIRCKAPRARCPKCGRCKTKRVGKQYTTILVNHMFLSNYTTVQLEVEKRRFSCGFCKNNIGGKDQYGKVIEGSTFLESLSFICFRHSYSEVFSRFILQEWEFSGLSELARKFHVSEKKVYEVINTLDISEIEAEKIEYMQTLSEIHIGIDEFSFSGHEYLVQINDLKTKKILGVLRSKDIKLLENWLDSLPLEIIHKITAISSDMHASFKHTIQKHIAKRTTQDLSEIQKQVISCVDHYHVKQLLSRCILEVFSMSNWMIKAGHYDKIIRDITTLETKNFNKYRESSLEFNVRDFREYKPDTIQYTPITLGYFLSKRYSNLLLMKSEKLTEKQCHRLNQILFEFDPRGYLKEVYLGKELLNEAFEAKDITLIEKLIHDFETSSQYKIQACGKTLKKWKGDIQNFFHSGITNAFTEGKNTKAKLFKRMAYGYSKKDNFIKRLLLCL